MVAATYGIPQTAPGLLAWIDAACDWELNRRGGMEYELQPTGLPATALAGLDLHQLDSYKEFHCLIADPPFPRLAQREPVVAGSSPTISTELCPVREVQQPSGACSSTPGLDPS